jgi:spore maturation protein CgeB
MNIEFDHPASPAKRRDSTNPPRVLVVGSHIFPDALEWHIVDSFRHQGCPVEFFETQLVSSGTPGPLQYIIRRSSAFLLREPERMFESRLVRQAQQFDPALILVTLGNQVSPKTIARLRTATRASIVCWCQDQMTTIGRQFLLGSEYDAVFVKDRYMQDLFSRMIRSTSFHYLPEACNPRVHRTVELNTGERKLYECDVMIAGTLYYYRQEILRQLTDYDLKVWGLRPDWLLSRLNSQYFGKPVFADDKARAVAGAKVCLNTLHYGEVDGLNCRAFEIAGCGGFQLITSVPVLGEHFDVGREIVEFRTATQLVELVRHYLDHPEIAAQIARRGQERAHRDHTFEHRLKEILRIALGYGAVAT